MAENIRKTSFFDAIASNKTKTFVLLFLMFFVFMFLIMVISYLFDLGTFGVILGLFVLLIYAGISYFSGDGIILALSGAKQVEKRDYPFLFNTVEGLALAAQLPMPKLYVINDAAPNAFATGRDPKHASVAVTTGLLEITNRQELEGVIAHEISHVANYDILFATVAVVFAGAITLISDFVFRSMVWGGRSRERRGGSGLTIAIGIIFAILAPIFAEIIRFAISREREYLADVNGARLTRNPDGLIEALEKIKKADIPVAHATEATAPLYFAKPLTGNIGFLFSTHPPIEERIKRLKGFY